MYLRSLELENFAGLRQARLDFDATTVLVGENDCGRTSLLSALAVALAGPPGSAPRLEAHHFHRPAGGAAPAAGPIRIALTFEEGAAGEWRQPLFSAISALLPPPGPGHQRLVLEIRAEPPAEDAVVTAHWVLRAPGGGATGTPDSIEQLEACRRACPLLWLRSGWLLAGGQSVAEVEDADEPPTETLSADLVQLVAEVEQRYAAMLSGTSPNELEELKAGYAAARELLQLREAETQRAGSLSHAPIADVLGPRARSARRGAVAVHGSAAQQLGALIVTAAVIRRGLGRAADGLRPLLVVEDPEAHLHPMTLASVWGLLEHAGPQMIIGTQSQTLLAAAPLASLRRLVRHDGCLQQWRVHPDALTPQELRKLSYHVRSRRGAAMFARCWLLVEGESEFWMLPELARASGYDFNIEGVACIEFAQCGLAPLVKVARELGIEWHVLSDGDETGLVYAEDARKLAGGEDPARRITRLRERDLENCLWRHGYAGVYLEAAGEQPSGSHRIAAGRVIRRAFRRHSKPYLAFEALAAVAAPGSPGVPAPLARLIETCVQLAREAPARGAQAAANCSSARRA
jgi:putative ATP-dependent endonuclease of the OLD family